MRLAPSTRPYKMWLYPFQTMVAFLGWLFVFLISGWRYVAFGFVTLAARTAVVFLRATWTRTWPFLGSERVSSN